MLKFQEAARCVSRSAAVSTYPETLIARRYVLQQKLGSGSFGTVYLVSDKKAKQGEELEDTETVSNSSEGRASPNDVLETIFVRKVGAFVNKPINQVTLTSLDIPFAMFAPKNLELEDADPMVNPPDSPETGSPLQGSLHSEGSSGGSSGNTHDDFVMINFKPAFSKDDILPMDLGTFYREFQNPPQLSSLSIDIGAQSMAEDLDSLPEKLAVHEKNVREFDAFVETLQ